MQARVGLSLDPPDAARCCHRRFCPPWRERLRSDVGSAASASICIEFPPLVPQCPSVACHSARERGRSGVAAVLKLSGPADPRASPALLLSFGRLTLLGFNSDPGPTW